jgi:hypothetical protein
MSHASSVLQPPMLTSSPPRPSVTADIAPQDTRDPSTTSTMVDTKPVAHVLTRKTYIANQNKMCLKAAQEDTVDGSVSSMLGLSRDDIASLPTYRHWTHTNSTLS